MFALMNKYCTSEVDAKIKSAAIFTIKYLCELYRFIQFSSSFDARDCVYVSFFGDGNASVSMGIASVFLSIRENIIILKLSQGRYYFQWYVKDECGTISCREETEVMHACDVKRPTDWFQMNFSEMEQLKTELQLEITRFKTKWGLDTKVVGFITGELRDFWQNAGDYAKDILQQKVGAVFGECMLFEDVGFISREKEATWTYQACKTFLQNLTIAEMIPPDYELMGHMEMNRETCHITYGSERVLKLCISSVNRNYIESSAHTAMLKQMKLKDMNMKPDQTYVFMITSGCAKFFEKYPELLQDFMRISDCGGVVDQENQEEDQEEEEDQDAKSGLPFSGGSMGGTINLNNQKDEDEECR